MTPPIYAVLGPTASGKSALALKLAERHGAELVVCDSVMAYRGFDIGANKPSAEEQRLAPHHGLDLCDATETLNAGVFAARLEPVLQRLIAARQPFVFVVGNYLYYRALAYGLGPLPASSPELRARYDAKERSQPGWLASEVLRIDPESHAEAHGKNLPRLVRALEVFELTGQSASALRRAHGGFTTPRWPVQRFLLEPPREVLRKLIEQRSHEMLQRGWLDEVRQLRAAGVPPDCKPMQAIGYKQINQFLDGALAEAALGDAIARATVDYAKRQQNFFAQEPDVQVLPLHGGDVVVP